MRLSSDVMVAIDAPAPVHAVPDLRVMVIVGLVTTNHVDTTRMAAMSVNT